MRKHYQQNSFLQSSVGSVSLGGEIHRAFDVQVLNHDGKVEGRVCVNQIYILRSLRLGCSLTDQRSGGLEAHMDSVPGSCSQKEKKW